MIQIIRKIAFIFPPTTLNSVGVENSFVPNGILTLANQIEEWNPAVEIKIFDGSVKNINIIVDEVLDFQPQIVGVSALCSNYEAGKFLLKKFKEEGIITVLGNHHANYLWSIIPKMKEDLFPEIDFIITGNSDGDTLIPLIENIQKGNNDFQEIDNVCFRENNLWVRPQSIKYKNATLSFPELKYIESFEPYFKNYRRVFKTFHNDIEQVKAININFFKGCTQGSNKPCVYCCLKDHKIQSTEPSTFWTKIESLYHEYGFNFFWETANSLTSLSLFEFTHGRNYLEELADTMPESLKNKISFMVYARADELNPATVALLKRLNVLRVVIGLDSGDAEILKSGLLKENVPEGLNYEVAKMLDHNDIQIYGCYVPGAYGENEDSLLKTKNEIFEIMQLKNCCAIEYTSLAPMPGSIAWGKIRTKFYSENGVSDIVNVSEISKFWIKTIVPTVDWQMIEKVKQEVQQNSNELNIVFGGYY